MNRRFQLLTVSLVVALLLMSAALALLGTENQRPLPALAQEADGMTPRLSNPASSRAALTVCPAGPPTCGYATVQAAVDAAAAGDIIQVAAGVYTDLHPRPAPAGYTGATIITQVVYLTKTVTIQGGYTTSFTEPPDPEANPTTLDAQGGEPCL